MIPVYFHTETDAVLAAKALPASMPSTAPTMVEPFHGRSWLIEVDVDPQDTRDFQVALQVVYRYQGEVHQAPLTTRPGGAPFMNRMPQSVIDRYNAENPQRQHTASQQRYYHGTDAELAEGDVVRPGDEIGKTNWPGMDNGWGVWMTPHHDLAQQYGRHVYEVHPQGEVTDWAEENGWERTRENNEYVAPSAKVVRHVGS